MSSKKVKTTAKLFVSDRQKINAKVNNTMSKIADIVGATLGPSGRVCLIESEYYAIPNKNTKDGVTVFKALGANDPFEHLIIEQTRDAAIRTASEAGDGTTTATILAAGFTTMLLDFCDKDPRFSPQRVVRIMNKTLKDTLLPYVKKESIVIGTENAELLAKVAKVSANGDDEISEAVIDVFEKIGYGASSHVTIRELSGPGGYETSVIEGYPIPMGYEESIGKFHAAFINDQGNLRCHMENPVFLLFDGHVSDIVRFEPLFHLLGGEFERTGNFKNIVFMAHGFGDSVLNQLAVNFSLPNTINIFPLSTPMNAVKDSRSAFLADIAAFTGSKIFGLKDQVHTAMPDDLGGGMEAFEAYRFRSTIVGSPLEENIQDRVHVLETQLKNPESEYAKRDLEERLGKLTQGIGIIKIYGGSSGELKERHDRVEDAVCAVRAAITDGALPGGCRILVDLALMLHQKKGTAQEERVWREVMAPAMLKPLYRLLDNAGYNKDESETIMKHLALNKGHVYDVENQVFGEFLEMGVFDASRAVHQALSNAVSIASVMGVMGGMICFPRDHQLEREEAQANMDFERTINNAEQIVDNFNDSQ